ncbi:MAG: hypothetical protein ACJAUH_000522 [Saprospiraceae bacterium]|jgi:hypothetical protein
MAKKETLLEQVFREVPDFRALYEKVRTNVLLSSNSESTLNNYTNTTAKLSLHSGCTSLELTDAQINDYLLMWRDHSH